MIKFAERVRNTAPSATLAVAAKARELAASGVEVVSFGTGEPDFDTPEHIREAAIKALNAGMTRYPPVTGYPELRKEIVKYVEKMQGLSYDPGEILVTVGAKQAIYNLCQVLLEEGDEAIISAPYWVSYPDMVRLAGARPVIVDPDTDFIPVPEKIEAAISEKTRLLFINSPGNPSGSVYPAKILSEIANILRRHPGIMVVSDDIYSRLIYSDSGFFNLAMIAPDLRDRVVLVDGVSKAYAMTGWRVGWALAKRPIIDRMAIVQGQSTSGVTAFAQAGAIAALQGDQTVVEKMLSEFLMRRDHMVKRLNSIRGINCRTPGGAFYTLPDIRCFIGKKYDGKLIETSSDVAEILIEKHATAVVDGAPFGAEGFIRLSFAASMEQIDKGLDRISAFADSIE